MDYLVVMDTKPPCISGIDFHWVQVDDVLEEADQLRGHFEDVANRICALVSEPLQSVVVLRM